MPTGSGRSGASSSTTESESPIAIPAGLCGVINVDGATIPGYYAYFDESDDGYPMWTSDVGAIFFEMLVPTSASFSSAAAGDGGPRRLAIVGGEKSVLWQQSL